MGTELQSSESAYPPTAISYPLDDAESAKLHTVIMVDLDHETIKGNLNSNFYMADLWRLCYFDSLYYITLSKFVYITNRTN